MSHSPKKITKPAVEAFSMTGFGKAQEALDSLTLELELRSVNSRFLDINFKIPRVYSEFESALRSALQKKLERGRVEVYLQRTVTEEDAGGVGFNQGLYKQYMALYKKVAPEDVSEAKDFLQEATLRILDRREVLDAAEKISDSKKEKKAVLSVVEKALEELLTMRKVEGASIFADIEDRFSMVKELTAKIENLSSDAVSERFDILSERMKELLADTTVDESRLYSEAALLADKADITEELVRIQSHCEQWEKIKKQQPKGRKLEFLLQELGREFNTIASKTNKAEVQACVVEVKSCFEKMREQAANLE